MLFLIIFATSLVLGGLRAFLKNSQKAGRITPDSLPKSVLEEFELIRLRCR